MTTTNPLIYTDGHLITRENGHYVPVSWERDTDPTERIMASTLAGQYTYQIEGPGDLESPEEAEQKDPSINGKAQARARLALYRAARIRNESYLRDDDLPEVVGPYDIDCPEDIEEEFTTDELVELSECSFAPTVDEAVQADEARHGLHPDLRMDGERGYWQGEEDHLANLRDMWKAHANNQHGIYNGWLLLAIEANGWIASQRRLEEYKRTDANASLHMSRGKADREQRYMGLQGLLYDINKSCQEATSQIIWYGRKYAQFSIAYARQGLAWLKILWGQYVNGRSAADVKNLAGLCPVLAANQRWITKDQRTKLTSSVSTLLARWSHITNLTRQEAEEYHRNVIMALTPVGYKGANIDYSEHKRSDSLTQPMGSPVTKVSNLFKSWPPVMDTNRVKRNVRDWEALTKSSNREKSIRISRVLSSLWAPAPDSMNLSPAEIRFLRLNLPSCHEAGKQ